MRGQGETKREDRLLLLQVRLVLNSAKLIIDIRQRKCGYYYAF